MLTVLRAIGRLWIRATVAVQRFDQKMHRHYRPKRLALVTVAAIGGLMAFMLFVPPCLGLSNDGSLDSVLADVGLSRIAPEDKTAYFSYYERTYSIGASAFAPGSTPLPLRLVVKLAIWLDTLSTRDAMFDMRFLAGIYLMAYLLALYPLISGILQRVSFYSHGLLTAVFAVLIFADSVLAVRFASLYTAPIECIALVGIADTAFVLPAGRTKGVSIALMALCVLILMAVNPYCALTGMVAATLLIYLTLKKQELRFRILCMLLAMGMTVSSVYFTNRMVDRQTRVEKYNQMTRGVLFQAENPTEALQFFGIEPRYSILTDTYGDQEFPVVLPDDHVLEEGFFDHYNTTAVLSYYLTHPATLFGMFDRGVHQAFISRSDYSGHYEQSEGLPPRTKTPFLSIWSTFKQQFAPKTAGVVLLMAIALVLLSRGRKKNQADGEKEAQYRTLIAVFIAMAAIELITVVIMSGDAELLRESFVMGVAIDVMAAIFATEVIRKAKTIDVEGDD